MAGADANADENVARELSSVRERLAGLEATVEQIDTRLGRVEDGQDRLRAEMTELRRDFRRWFVAMFVAFSAVVTVLQFVV